MAHIKLELNEETMEVTVDVKDLNPIQVVNLCLGACQQAMGMIKTNNEKSKIIKYVNHI